MCHRKKNIRNIFTRVHNNGDFVPLLPRGKEACPVGPLDYLIKATFAERVPFTITKVS